MAQFQGSHLLFGGAQSAPQQQHQPQMQEIVVTETTTSRLNRRGDTMTTTTTTTYTSPTSRRGPGGFPGFPQHQLVTQMVGQNNSSGACLHSDDTPEEVVMEVCTNTTIDASELSPSGIGGSRKKKRAFKDRKRSNRRKEEFLLASASRGGILHLAPMGMSGRGRGSGLPSSLISLAGQGGSSTGGSSRTRQPSAQVLELIELAPTASASAPMRGMGGTSSSTASMAMDAKQNKRLAKKAGVMSNPMSIGRKKMLGAGSSSSLGPKIQGQELAHQLQYQHAQFRQQQQQQQQQYEQQQMMEMDQQPNNGYGNFDTNETTNNGGGENMPFDEEDDEHFGYDAPFETPHLSPMAGPEAVPVLVALPSSAMGNGNAGVDQNFVEMESDDLFDALVI